MESRSLTRNINIILFVISFALRSYTDAVYEANGITGGLVINLKYVFMVAGIAFCIMQMIQMDSDSFIFNRELLNVCLVVIGFLFISIIMTLIHPYGIDSTGEMISELIKMILSIAYAYCVLNTFTEDDIYISMVFVLFFSMIGYVLEIGLDTFNLSNLQTINFNSSYSPFESHYAAGSAIAMCTYFSYYRKNKILSVISLIFALATFKRAAVIFAVIIFVASRLIDMNKTVKPWVIRTIKVMFFVATLAYYQILLPGNDSVFENLFGTDSYSLTMGRSSYIARLVNGGFESTGFGSTTIYIGKSIEMDLIKIFLELTVVGLILFINCYWNCAGTKRFTVIYMLFVFFNLLTSHSLTNSFSWILTFIIIGIINYRDIHLSIPDIGDDRNWKTNYEKNWNSNDFRL